MQRQYADPRGRASGSNEDFQLSQPHTINIAKDSVAVLDSVAIPNKLSWPRKV